jgi:hypothetical protein
MPRWLLLTAALTGSAVIIPAQADLITFDFTGRATVLTPGGSAVPNSDAAGMIDSYGYQTPISASLTFDTAAGLGSSDLAISGFSFLGMPTVIHGTSFVQRSGTSLFDGVLLVDWGPNLDMPSGIQWDATGLMNAISFGLQVGDKISGDVLYRDSDQDGLYSPAEIVVANLGSAIPYTDNGVQTDDGFGPVWYPNQGPAPMASTGETAGLTEGPFPGLRVYLDIGSGNSMYVTAIQPVPLPGAFWLMISGIVGVAAAYRRRG